MEIIQLARTIAGTQWFIIERERAGRPPLEGAALSLQNFRKLLAETPV